MRRAIYICLEINYSQLTGWRTDVSFIMIYIFLLLCLVNIPELVWADVSDPCASVKPGNDFLSPPFPTRYSSGGYKVLVRAIIANKHMTVDATEYTDVFGYQASTLSINQNGTNTLIIVHYQTNEIFYISSKLDGLSSSSRICISANMTTTNSSQLFNVIPDNSTGLPHLFTVDMLYSIASAFKVMYIGREVVDRTVVNHWASCVNWPHMNVRFLMDYYFTVPGWQTPSGLQQVPLQVNVTGIHTYPNKTTSLFSHIYQYVDFEKYDKDPKEIFETPEGVLCLLRQQLKPAPKLSNAFYFREEISNPLFQSTLETDIWYDYDLLLVRYDSRITPTTNSILFSDDGPFTVIHDYNTGVQYAIDQSTQICDISPLPMNAIGFDAVHNIARDTLGLRSPLAFFNLQGVPIYAGQRKARGIICDVFQTVLTNFSGMSASLYEVYFPSDAIMSNNVGHGFSSVSKDFPMKIMVWGSEGILMNQYNIFDFDQEHFRYNVYDISPCYPDESSSINFQITFSVETTNLVDRVQNQILGLVHNTIGTSILISPLRLQKTSLYWDDTYLYYQAQILDKAPPIAKYEKHSGQIMLASYGKNLQGIASIQDCASQCDALNEWLCTSFDYCGSSRICVLGKPYAGSLPLANNTNCDHFSRIVGGGSNKEVSLSDAWKALKNMVYITGLSVAVPVNTAANNIVPEASPGISDQVQALHLKAFSITDQVYAGSNVLTGAASMKQFRSIPGKKAKGFDDHLSGISVDECAAQCITELMFTCQSFSYCSLDGSCFMSQQHPDEHPTMLKVSSSCDVFYREYTSMYEQIPGVALALGSDTVYQNIITASECAKLCTYYNSFHCQSFDFCPGVNTCFLGRTHYYDVPSGVVVQNVDCAHYSRNYLDDFMGIQNTRIELTENRIIAAVTPQQCAKLCTEELNFECNTFDYCANRTWCRLFGGTLTGVGQVTGTQNAYCTVYKREFANTKPGQNHSLPSGSSTAQPYARGSGKTYPSGTSSYSHILQTGSGKTYPSVTSRTQTLELRKKISGGAVAGIVIGILLAVMIGVGVTYFVIRWRRKREDDREILNKFEMKS